MRTLKSATTRERRFSLVYLSLHISREKPVSLTEKDAKPVGVIEVKHIIAIERMQQAQQKGSLSVFLNSTDKSKGVPSEGNRSCLQFT